MRTIIRRRDRRASQSGSTLIEALIAGAVLVFGFMSLMLLVTTAIATNNRNKLDSSAVMLAASVAEQINARWYSGSTATITDCTGNSTTISFACSPATNPPGAGAKLNGANIDFSETTPQSGYQMNFVVAGNASNNICKGTTEIVYDVRWNVQCVPNTAFASTYLLTVGVQPTGKKYFGLPLTLRTLVGPN